MGAGKSISGRSGWNALPVARALGRLPLLPCGQLRPDRPRHRDARPAQGPPHFPARRGSPRVGNDGRGHGGLDVFGLVAENPAGAFPSSCASLARGRHGFGLGRLHLGPVDGAQVLDRSGHRRAVGTMLRPRGRALGARFSRKGGVFRLQQLRRRRRAASLVGSLVLNVDWRVLFLPGPARSCWPSLLPGSSRLTGGKGQAAAEA